MYGEGSKVLFMFHGFGHSLKNMKGVEEALASDYKIYSFDLFFHGFSEWNHNDTALGRDFWQRMIAAFLEENGITRFSLLGFSLGAKVALVTTELFPDKMENLYLMAPDGIKSSFIYNVSTLGPFRGLFRSLILHPQLFQRLVTFLSLLKLIDKSVLRFASIQMNSRDKRRRVYYTWTVYKGLKPNLSQLIKDLNKYEIATEIYLGKYDRLIRPDQVKPFVNQLKKVNVHYLASGHNNLMDEVADYIVKEISKR